MKEYYIDTHLNQCIESKKIDNYYGRYCELNPNRFLFFLKTNFFLITYNNCISHYDHLEFKKMLIERIIGNNKLFEYYEVNRGVDVNDDFKNFRIRNQSLRKYIQQINFIYNNAAGKKYAITTKTKYIDSICNQEEIKTNYNNAKDFLIKNEYDWLLPELEELYYKNTLFNDNVAEYHKTIEHLINSINQLTK